LIFLFKLTITKKHIGLQETQADADNWKLTHCCQTAFVKPQGQALIRNGTTIHTGHTVPGRERNTLSIGWSKWQGGPSDSDEPAVADGRNAWQLDPAVREALPHDWMRVAW